jgi:hypothetical protein
MRATHCCLLAMLGLLGCGGTLISSDGGEEDAAMGDEEPLSVLDAGGSGDATGPAAGYCVIKTCDGLSLCGAGQTCAVGDGCNSCSCTALAGDMASSSCSTNGGCSCP